MLFVLLLKYRTGVAYGVPLDLSCRRPQLLLEYSVALMLNLRHRLTLMCFSKLAAADKYAVNLCFCCSPLLHWLAQQRARFDLCSYVQPCSLLPQTCGCVELDHLYQNYLTGLRKSFAALSLLVTSTLCLMFCLHSFSELRAG